MEIVVGTYESSETLAKPTVYSNGIEVKWLGTYLSTIHKKTLCLTQKSPETWWCSHNLTSFAKFEYGITL